MKEEKRRAFNKAANIHNVEGLNNQRFWWMIDRAREHFEPGMTALDLGCATGIFSFGLFLVGYDVLGVDKYKPGPQYPHIKFDNMDFHTFFKQRKRQFDLVHLGQVLEHVRDPEELLFQAVKPCRGRLIVSVPDFESPGHVRTYTWESFFELVDKYMKNSRTATFTWEWRRRKVTHFMAAGSVVEVL